MRCAAAGRRCVPLVRACPLIVLEFMTSEGTLQAFRRTRIVVGFHCFLSTQLRRSCSAILLNRKGGMALRKSGVLNLELGKESQEIVGDAYDKTDDVSRRFPTECGKPGGRMDQHQCEIDA